MTTKILATLSPKGSSFELARPTLEAHIQNAQKKANFPKQVLQRSPAHRQRGIRWERLDTEGSDFEVRLDGSVTYQMNIAAGARFIEDGPAGRSRGAPKPAISALSCLSVPPGLVRFWHALLNPRNAEGELAISLNGTSGKFLSFDAFDERLELRYPAEWNYTFWNHDGKQACEETIELFRPVPSKMTVPELAEFAAQVFADIACFFGFPVHESSSHPMARIRELASQLIS